MAKVLTRAFFFFFFVLPRCFSKPCPPLPQLFFPPVAFFRGSDSPTQYHTPPLGFSFWSAFFSVISNLFRRQFCFFLLSSLQNLAETFYRLSFYSLSLHCSSRPRAFRGVKVFAPASLRLSAPPSQSFHSVKLFFDFFPSPI